MTKIKRLPEAELEIMLLLWQAETAVPRNYFDKALKEDKRRSKFTMMVDLDLLSILWLHYFNFSNPIKVIAISTNSSYLYACVTCCLRNEKFLIYLQ
mgnify:CR=1 FL=1